MILFYILIWHLFGVYSRILWKTCIFGPLNTFKLYLKLSLWEIILVLDSVGVREGLPEGKTWEQKLKSSKGFFMWTLGKRAFLTPVWEKRCGKILEWACVMWTQVPARRPVSEGQRSEGGVWRDSQSHIFKVSGSWLDLVEQWEVVESFKERNNMRGLMLAKAPLAAIGEGR